MDILEMIRRQAFRPIRNLALIHNPLQIHVKFADDFEVTCKVCVNLRMWAVMNQNMHFEPIEGETGHCVSTPLSYGVLLGFRPGDAVRARDAHGVEQSILFS